MNMTDATEHAVRVIAWRGALTVSNIDAFRAEMDAALASDSEFRWLLIDFSATDMMDSSGLGGLLAIRKQLQDRGGQLGLVGLMKKVRLLFEITNADAVFPMYESVTEGREALQGLG